MGEARTLTWSLSSMLFVHRMTLARFSARLELRLWTLVCRFGFWEIPSFANTTLCGMLIRSALDSPLPSKQLKHSNMLASSFQSESSILIVLQLTQKNSYHKIPCILK